MRILNIALLAAAASVGSAQNLTGLPTCVLGAAVSGLSATGCDPTNYKCICSSSSFISTLQAAASKACSAMDYANAEKFAQTLCASVGIILGATTSSSSTTSSTSTASSSSTATTSSVSTSPATTTLMSITESTVYVTVCSTSTTATTVVTPSSNVTSTKTAAPSSSFTGAASAYSYSAFGGVVALAAALFL